jgi:hypothetical protein
MTTPPGNGGENGEEQRWNLPADIPGGTVYSYNLDDSKTPGGIKVRYKIRVVDGPEATRYDTRQTQAILELLRWTHRHSRQLRQARPGP